MGQSDGVFGGPEFVLEASEPSQASLELGALLHTQTDHVVDLQADHEQVLTHEEDDGIVEDLHDTMKQWSSILIHNV